MRALHVRTQSVCPRARSHACPRGALSNIHAPPPPHTHARRPPQDLDAKIKARGEAVAGPLKDKLETASAFIKSRIHVSAAPPPHALPVGFPRAPASAQYPHTQPAIGPRRACRRCLALPCPNATLYLASPLPPPGTRQAGTEDKYIAGHQLSYGDLNLFVTLSTMVSGWMEGARAGACVGCARVCLSGWRGGKGAAPVPTSWIARLRPGASCAKCAPPSQAPHAPLLAPQLPKGVPKDLLNDYPVLKEYRNLIASHSKVPARARCVTCCASCVAIGVR